MTHTTSEILDLAADDIQRNGWAQGPEGMTVDGPHCALGAIGAVLGGKTHIGLQDLGPCYSMDPVAEHPSGRALGDYLPRDPASVSRDTCFDIYFWNDAAGRTAEDVVAALRAAAAIERVKETSTEKVPA